MFQLKIKSLSPELLLTGVTLSACCPVLQSVADDCLSALEVEAADVSAASQPLAATVSSPLKKARPARAGKVIAGGLSFKSLRKHWIAAMPVVIFCISACPKANAEASASFTKMLTVHLQ